MGNLSKDFSAWEFRCQCGCGLEAVDPRLIEKLQALRSACGFTLNISSGCRCKSHNKNEGGADNSAHLPKGIYKATRGCDVIFHTSDDLDKLLALTFTVGFRRRGLYKGKNIIHIDVADMDGTHARDVTWIN